MWPAFYSMTVNQTRTQKVKLILVTLIQSITWLREERHGASCCDLQRKKKENPKTLHTHSGHNLPSQHLSIQLEELFQKGQLKQFIHRICFCPE